MTLIINEIHTKGTLKNSFQIAAADRRITSSTGRYDSTRRKIFPIPYLKATVSYFGLAAYLNQGKWHYFSEWFPNFINSKAGKISTLKEFAFELQKTLNTLVGKTVLARNRSGIHISGYNSNDHPEFWYFSNISGMNEYYYLDPLEKYTEPTSDFLERDAMKDPFLWDQVSENIGNGTVIYRNGDIRTHALASEEIDEFMDRIFELPDFNNPSNIQEYASYVKFKFEIISMIYKKWTNNPIIAKPIDVYILKKNEIIKL